MATLLRREVRDVLRAWYARRITRKQFWRAIDIAQSRFGRDREIDRLLDWIDESYDDDAGMIDWTKHVTWRDFFPGLSDPPHPPRDWKRGIAQIVLWLRAGEARFDTASEHRPFASSAAFERANRTAHLLAR